MLRKIRITLATLMLIGITWLFVDFTGTAHHYVGWMPKIQLLEAILAGSIVTVAALVVLTLLFGRMYCSVVCPLGIMQDIFGWMGKKSKKNRYTFSKAKTWLRYTMLALLLIAHVAGLAVIVQLLAPYSAFGRIATNLLQPIYLAVNNVLASIAEQNDNYMFYHSDVWMRSAISLAIAAATIAVLAVLAWRNGRTWCNTVCPVGTMLSIISKYSLLKIHFDKEKCRNCSLCTKNCKAACIDYKTHTVDATRCIVCGDCLKSCKFGALTYGRATASGEKASTSEVDGEQKTAATADSSRRSFLLSSALLATTALAQDMKKVDGGLAEIEDKVAPKRQTPLVPPGSLSAQNMTNSCTGCQLCISECPNQVL
ncbi:MAG: 4Fe-4S binding protein, partial [Prevotella sp.]|nr:4Fe-4S binding protein [Prevotella sp.]